jgi:hypothetical protein
MFSFEALVWLKLIEHTPLNTKMHISARTQFFRELAIDSKFDMDRLIMIPIYQNKTKNNVFIQCRPCVDPQFLGGFFWGGGR